MRATRQTALLVTALLVAVALVVTLARRLDSLSASYRELQLLSTTLHRGSMVPSFTAKSLSGHDLVVGEIADSTGKQLVFLFTTTCPFCLKSLGAWKALAESVAVRNDSRMAVVGLSLDSPEATTKYVDQHRIAFDVSFLPDLRSKRLFRSGKVPQTVVLDFDGHVVHSHIGALELGTAMDSVLAAMRPTTFGRDSLQSTLSQR